MCGICGVVWTGSQRPVTAEMFADAVGALYHRGPDDEGFYEHPHALLGFRRLAIIDIESGHQPMSNEDGTVWVVFNGEVYNFAELRRDLAAKGHRFRTRSDTEVIVHLYEDLEEECIGRLRGMFALAIWDERRRKLVLARDRLGQKPLVYWQGNGTLAFASELKALRRLGLVRGDVNPFAIDAFLTYQYIPHPMTIYTDAHKLPPGHLGVWENGQFSIRPYWQPPLGEETALPEAEAIERLRHLLTEAVQLRLISDVPLGAFLSGGVDSTIVVGLMQQTQTQPTQTFCVGFTRREFDERHYARAVAEHLGTEHREQVVEPDCMAIFPRLAWFYDEPFGDSSAIPTFLLSEWTRQHVTVALTGDGGDELFAGYPRYRAVRLGGWFDRLPAVVRYVIANPLWRHLPVSPRQKSKLRRLRKLMLALRESPERRYLRWIVIFDNDARHALYSAGFRRALGDADPAEFLMDAYSRCAGRDFVTRTGLVDLLTYLPCDLLTKVDIASMAHSLECRSPFLDHHVVEFAVRLPLRYKMRRLSGKWILKRAFAPFFPPSVRRRPKMGFGVPIDSWFRGPLAQFVRDVLLDPASLSRGYFDRAAIETLVSEHTSGAWDHSYRLWCLVMLELWHRFHLDKQAVRPPETPLIRTQVQ